MSGRAVNRRRCCCNRALSASSAGSYRWYRTLTNDRKWSHPDTSPRCMTWASRTCGEDREWTTTIRIRERNYKAQPYGWTFSYLSLDCCKLSQPSLTACTRRSLRSDESIQPVFPRLTWLHGCGYNANWNLITHDQKSPRTILILRTVTEVRDHGQKQSPIPERLQPVW